MSSTWAFISFCFLALAMILHFRSSSNNSTVTKADQSSSLARSTMLLLMVKNEEQVIERMLSSAKQGARFLFICDTGSTDGTLAIVERVWRKNYRIYQTNFTNFETTRNECNAHAHIYLKDMRSLGVSLEYVLLADADFVYVERAPPPPAAGSGGGQNSGTFDINTIQIHAGISGHPHNSLNMLIKYDTFIYCRYRLWTHEYLDCSAAIGNVSIGHYTHFYYIDYADGKSRPEKLTRDIRLLEGWLKYVNETDLRPRALYYLARAYEDSGQLKKAMRTYEQHNAVQVFTNYQFYAKYRMALITMQQMYEQLNSNNNSISLSNADAVVEAAFWSAIAQHDGFFRQEPLYWLARYFRQRGQLNKCIIYATAGMHLPAIDHARMPLFLETHIEEWALREELAYCLKLKGRENESLQHYKHILASASEKLDKDTLERIKKEVIPPAARPAE